MSGQYPGAGSGLAPASSPDGAKAPAPRPAARHDAGLPDGRQFDAGQPDAGQLDAGQAGAFQSGDRQFDGGQPDAGGSDLRQFNADAAPGWGVPPAASTVPAAAPAWGVPPAASTVPTAPAATGWGAPAAPGWGAPEVGPRVVSGKQWTMKRGLAVAGVAAVLAVGSGLGVYALTSSSATADGTAAGPGAGPGTGGGQGFAPGMPGPAQGGFAGGGMSGQGGPGDFTAGGMGGLSAAVHADYVVLQGSQYVTMAEQTGTVSEVSSSSVTVKSSDGFTRSYALGSDVVVTNLQQRRQQAGGTASQLTVADIVAGGTVRIVAAKDGSGYTAASVMVVAATSTGSTGQSN